MGYPEREKAALDFRVQVVQQFERDGEWINVGDAMSPLTMTQGDDDDKVACESVALQLSLAASGMHYEQSCWRSVSLSVCYSLRAVHFNSRFSIFFSFDQ